MLKANNPPIRRVICVTVQIDYFQKSYFIKFTVPPLLGGASGVESVYPIAIA